VRYGDDATSPVGSRVSEWTITGTTVDGWSSTRGWDIWTFDSAGSSRARQLLKIRDA
jgi:hypothetical protein